MKSLCLQCKGRNWCGKPCTWNKITVKKVEYKKEFTGSSPTVFIGKANYPNVNIGIMSPQLVTEKAKDWDDPYLWTKEYNINQVVEKRTTLVNCTNKLSESFMQKVQEVALSKKPVNVEFELSKTPKARVDYDFTSNPMGPSSEIKKIIVCDNISMHKTVEKCFYDYDLKSVKAVTKLYEKGFNENDITRMFCTGAFGLKKDRKVVPTRWSITAVDDSLGKQLINNIKNYNNIDNYRILSGNFYGNYYTIILLPSVWGFELFETTDGKTFCHDLEDYNGRKGYAYETAGGYYACRLAVLEYLNMIKRQARAVVFRQVTSEYSCPLGVWVVRQATRKAVENTNCFNTKEEMLNSLRIITPLHYLINKSELFETFNTQRLLTNYL
ncbi:MAG: hypothetical protein JW791_01645 [Nanoarchaeota archaeon]|nr:hypothetical protein [Nanoarchaeota archaeon]